MGGFSWGGFSQGLNQGLQTADRIGSMIDDAQISRLRSKGMKEAQEAAAKAQADASASVQDTGEQGMEQAAVASPAQAPVETFKVDMGPGAIAAQGISSGAQGRYVSGGKAFNDKGKAEAHAKSKAPTDMDFFIKNAIPQVAAKYMEQGQPEMAEAWTQYAGKKEAQKHMETWAKAKRAVMTGDWDGFADNAMQMHKNLKDGITATGYEKVQGEGGVSGIKIKFKNDETGEEGEQFIDADMTGYALGAMSPTEMFKQEQAEQQQAKMIRAKVAADDLDATRALMKDTTKTILADTLGTRRDDRKAKSAKELAEVRGEQEIAQIRERAKVETDGLGAKAKAELAARKDALKEAGYSDDDINGMVPALLKVDSFKKGTSPEERRAMIVSDLSKDPAFLRAKPEKKAEQVAELMKLVGEGAPSVAPKPKPAAAKPKTAGLQVYDPATGKMVALSR